MKRIVKQETIRRLLAWVIRFSGLPFLIREIMSRRVTIVVYHNPEPAVFETHLMYLTNRFKIIPLEQLVGAIEEPNWQKIPPKYDDSGIQRKTMKVLVVTNMYPQPDQPAFGTFVKDQVDALRRAGVEADVLFINGRASRWNYVWGLFQFWQRVVKKRYDVIHAHYVLSGIIARLQLFVPVVATYHGSELGVARQHWLARLARAASPFFQRVIVVSPQMKQKLDGSHVRVIPCGVNLEDLSPIPVLQARQQLGLPLDKPLVLWAGEPWRPEKRYAMLEQAVELVRQDMPDAELVLVSGQPHAVIPLYMSACDVLALTSAHEGSPMVIKEAMACNLPIVSVDVGDVAAVIGETAHCYLVEPTPEAVAEKLRRVLANRQRTDGRSRIGHLESNFIAGQIMGVYKEVCSPRVNLSKN